ncbi:MAG: hypothetical protein Q9212_001993 [Teloschistes hypoglaucus]
MNAGTQDRLSLDARMTGKKQYHVLFPSLPPTHQPGATPTACSRSQSDKRRSLVTDQIYQFALGYPQTPPEPSPLLELPVGSRERQEILGSAMGSFVFKWDHPADEVYVTGTFDDWAKSVKLEKEDGVFVKQVELPLGQTILYKFVVDGNWTTDPTAPQEDDGANNVNNLLTPDRISETKAKSPHSASAIMSNVTAQSTTAKLAGEVPKESSREPPKEPQGTDTTSSDLPGTFPETPALESSSFSVNPIPATSGFGNPVNLEPGEKVPEPNKITSNTVSSTVKDDPSLSKSHGSEQTFGVAPLPATGGFGNPVHLEPGEKVPDPSTFTSNTIHSHVTTDKESYDKGFTAPQLPDVVTPQKERDNKGASMFNLPEISKNMIPESSLPMGGTSSLEKDPGAFIQSAGAGSTTAMLAGSVPKEATGIPQVVQESQNEAGTDAEAGHNREAVREKSAVEKEIESKIPKAPATSEGIADQSSSSTAKDADSTTATGGASHALPASIQQSIDEINKGSAIAPTVPDVVQESITESHTSPEAAGDKTMVGEKSRMEEELLKKVPTEDAAGEPAPAASASLSASAPAPTDTQTTLSSGTSAQASAPNEPTEKLDALTSGPSNSDPPTSSTTGVAPITAPTSTETETETSKNAAKATATTAAPPTVSKGAKSFQSKSSAPPPATSGSATESKDPVTTAAAPAMTPATQQTIRKSSDYSREVSPMTKPNQQSVPTVTTGVGSSSAPQTSEPTSSKAPPSPMSNASASTDKKSKRASGFFGKLRAKFSDKDKDKK